MKKIILATAILVSITAVQSEEVNVLGINFGDPTCQQYETKLEKSKQLQSKIKLQIAELEGNFDDVSLHIDLLEKNLKVYDQLDMTNTIYETILDEYDDKLIDQDDLNVDLEDLYADESTRMRKFKILHKMFKRVCAQENK